MFTWPVLIAFALTAKVTFAMSSLLPPYSWDSHIHVIDPERFPLSPNRTYTPKAATTANTSTYLSSIGFAHTTIIQPSVYGTDNSALLGALAYFEGSARGVCVINLDTISNETLAKYHAAGVRGIRLNSIYTGNESTDEQIVDLVKKTAAVAKINNWVLQLLVPLKTWKLLHDTVPTLGVRLVSDHLGHTSAGSKTKNPLDTIDPYLQPGFTEMIDLVRRRLLFVKISGLNRNSKDAPLYQDMRVIVQTFMINGPEMVVFGSDWPHVDAHVSEEERLVPKDYLDVDDRAIVEELKEWAGSEEQVQRLFVDNPRRLWGWENMES